MRHSFNIQLAELIGVEKALILETLYHKVINDDPAVFKGSAWVFFAVKDFAKPFTYLTNNRVRMLLYQLKDDGYILIEKLDGTKQFHTKWFALSEKSVELLGFPKLKKAS